MIQIIDWGFCQAKAMPPLIVAFVPIALSALRKLACFANGEAGVLVVVLTQE